MILIDFVQSLHIILELSVNLIQWVQKLSDGTRSCGEKCYSNYHNNDAKNLFVLIGGWDVSIANSWDRCHSPINGDEIALSTRQRLNLIGIHPRAFILFIVQASKEYPETCNDVDDGDWKNEEKEEALEAFAYLEEVLGIFDYFVLFFCKFYYSQEFGKLNQLVHAAQSCYPNNII